MVPNRNGLKKLFVFSTEDSRVAIESRIKDIAAVRGKTESAVIEDALLSNLFPLEPNANRWAVNLFFSPNSGKALANAYANCFSYLSAGVRWRPKHSNALPLVELLYEQAYFQDLSLTGGEPEWNHLMSQWDSIIDFLKSSPDHEVLREAEEAELIFNAFKSGDYLYSELLTATNFLSLNWEHLKDYTRTYRALVGISKLLLPENTPMSRCNFIDVLSRVSADWSENVVP